MSSTLIEEALKKVSSQQQLVNIVSKRVKQLSTGHRPMIDFITRMGFADIALTEIIEGKLTFETPSPVSVDIPAAS
jgi:DNA-directed RNA polymerase subunit omega